jgi:hypothetical protein
MLLAALYMANFSRKTASDVRVGTVLSWADRILSLVNSGDLLQAVELTTSYYHGTGGNAITLGLPEERPARQALVEPKLLEIMTACVDYVFSENRMLDGTHYDPDGRGVDRTSLFEGLVGTCARACLAIHSFDFLLDDVYERYLENGIQKIYLTKLEPFILSGSLREIPTNIVQALISIYEDRGDYKRAERIIWHVEPHCLDINQALGLCHRHSLFDALIYVYTRALHDFVGPIVELLGLVRQIHLERRARPRHVSGSINGDFFSSSNSIDPALERLVPDAYKLFTFLSDSLTGLTYPSKEPLSPSEANVARNSVYAFLFSGRSLAWPEQGGNLVLTSDEDGSSEPTYPYIRLLLRFDAEATLDVLDLAFEDSYLNLEINGRPVNRQLIVNLLVEIVDLSSDDFTASDRTFLNIFVARNLPKYPQFVLLPASVLHRILVGLATDPDQSTREDRQLAAEYLLSVYTPHDPDNALVLFEQAGFFRILRSIYRSERKWPELASICMRDPDLGPSDIFQHLTDVLSAASRAPAGLSEELARVILDSIPQLVEYDTRSTALLVSRFFAGAHGDVISRLFSSPPRQFAYLRCLLEPDLAEEVEGDAPLGLVSPTSSLDFETRLHYLSLICEYDPSSAIRYLARDPLEVPSVVRICEAREVYDALVWSLDQAGETDAALSRLSDVLETRGELLVHSRLSIGMENGVLSSSPEHMYYSQVAAVVKVGIQICTKRSLAAEPPSSEDAWFRLLSSLVDLIGVAAQCSFAEARKQPSSSSSAESEGALAPSAETTTASLRSLLSDVLSSLISSTSSRDVPFPQLMRRLIVSQSAGGKRSANHYAEFRTILGSMLDTYTFDGDLLDLTNSLVERDLFEKVEELNKERGRGWRPAGTLCESCGLGVWGAGKPTASSGKEAGLFPMEPPHSPIEAIMPSRRPRLKSRPSLKGKEVHRPEEWETSPEPETRPGVTVLRDGRVYHVVSPFPSFTRPPP